MQKVVSISRNELLHIFFISLAILAFLSAYHNLLPPCLCWKQIHRATLESRPWKHCIWASYLGWGVTGGDGISSEGANTLFYSFPSQQLVSAEPREHQICRTAVIGFGRAGWGDDDVPSCLDLGKYYLPVLSDYLCTFLMLLFELKEKVGDIVSNLLFKNAMKCS